MNSTILRLCLGVLGAAMLVLGANHVATDAPTRPRWVVVAAAGLISCATSLWMRQKKEKDAL